MNLRSFIKSVRERIQKAAPEELVQVTFNNNDNRLIQLSVGMKYDTDALEIINGKKYIQLMDKYDKNYIAQTVPSKAFQTIVKYKKISIDRQLNMPIEIRPNSRLDDKTNKDHSSSGSSVRVDDVRVNYQSSRNRDHYYTNSCSRDHTYNKDNLDLYVSKYSNKNNHQKHQNNKYKDKDRDLYKRSNSRNNRKGGGKEFYQTSNLYRRSRSRDRFQKSRSRDRFQKSRSKDTYYRSRSRDRFRRSRSRDRNVYYRSRSRKSHNKNKRSYDKTRKSHNRNKKSYDRSRNSYGRSSDTSSFNYKRSRSYQKIKNINHLNYYNTNHISYKSQEKRSRSNHDSNDLEKVQQVYSESSSFNSNQEHVCYILGVPTDFNEKHVKSAIDDLRGSMKIKGEGYKLGKAKRLSWMFDKEEQVEYLRVSFGNQKSIETMISNNLKIQNNLVVVLPEYKDKTLKNMLQFHEIKVTSKDYVIDFQLLVQMYQQFQRFGEIVDIKQINSHDVIVIYNLNLNKYQLIPIPSELSLVQKTIDAQIQLQINKMSIDEVYLLQRKKIMDSVPNKIAYYQSIVKPVDKNHKD